MSEIALLIAKFGLPTIFGAAVVYIVLRGEFQFRYPRLPDLPNRDDEKLEG
jgi:hypothetical protein